MHLCDLADLAARRADGRHAGTKHGLDLAYGPETIRAVLPGAAPYWWPGSVGWGDYVQFLAVTCSIAAVLIGVTMLRLRAICSHESARQVRRFKSPGTWV